MFKTLNLSSTTSNMLILKLFSPYLLKAFCKYFEKLNAKQKILLDSYLDQDIDRQTFLTKNSSLYTDSILEKNQFAFTHRSSTVMHLRIHHFFYLSKF